MVSSRLYGDALRYYESLDLECQQDFEQLRDALSRRFPGAIRSGGLVRHDTAHWDQSGLPTSAEEPPLTALPRSGLADGVNSDVNTGEPRVPIYLNLKSLGNTVKVPTFLLGHKSSSSIRLVSRLTAHSLIIERAHGGTGLSPSSTTRVTTLDLSDKAAVAKAKKTPLTVVPANEAVNDLVGFVYTVHSGEYDVDFRHDVLAPKRSRILYSRGLGNRSVSPEGVRTEAFPISAFLSAGRSAGHREQVGSGTYVTKSSIRIRKPNSYNLKEWEEIGAVTWKITLV